MPIAYAASGREYASLDNGTIQMSVGMLTNCASGFGCFIVLFHFLRGMGFMWGQLVRLPEVG